MKKEFDFYMIFLFGRCVEVKLHWALRRRKKKLSILCGNIIGHGFDVSLCETGSLLRTTRSWRILRSVKGIREERKKEKRRKREVCQRVM